MKTKALVLLSGGLDSQIAVKILEEQGIEVEAICFTSNFYNAQKAEAAAKKANIKLHIVNIEKEMVELVKSPPSGYGKNMNPCIDCHAMMIRLAKKFADGMDCNNSRDSIGRPRSLQNDNTVVIATGEVLGQRPFSQNRRSLGRVEELSGVEVLRPLSAKLLNETSYEKTRIVLRHKLLSIEGRQRERQMELAKKYGIKDYPTPSGGCLLTDPGFSERLLLMINRWPKCRASDIELLKYGRMFWVKTQVSTDLSQSETDLNMGQGGWVLVMIGRHKEENENLNLLKRQGDVIIELDGVEGPTSLVRFSNDDFRLSNANIKLDIPEELKMSELGMDKDKSDEEIFGTVGLLTGWYAVKARGRNVKLRITNVE